MRNLPRNPPKSHPRMAHHGMRSVTLCASIAFAFCASTSASDAEVARPGLSDIGARKSGTVIVSCDRGVPSLAAEARRARLVAAKKDCEAQQ
jgi:hypothetical protein